MSCSEHLMQTYDSSRDRFWVLHVIGRLTTPFVRRGGLLLLPTGIYSVDWNSHAVTNWNNREDESKT